MRAAEAISREQVNDDLAHWMIVRLITQHNDFDLVGRLDSQAPLWDWVFARSGEIVMEVSRPDRAWAMVELYKGAGDGPSMMADGATIAEATARAIHALLFVMGELPLGKHPR